MSIENCLDYMKKNMNSMKKNGLNSIEKEILLALIQRESIHLKNSKKESSSYYILLWELRSILEPMVAGKKSRKKSKSIKKSKSKRHKKH